MLSLILVLSSVVTFHLTMYFSSSCDFSDDNWVSAYKKSIQNYTITCLVSLFLDIPTISYHYSQIVLFIPQMILSDFIFYFSHRLFHTKYLYSIHKQHHIWKSPVSSSFLDCNIIEHLTVNVTTVVIPLLVFNVSYIQSMIWVIMSTVSSITGHISSYDNNQPHVLHHRHSNCNYGAGGFYIIDKLLGTYR